MAASTFYALNISSSTKLIQFSPFFLFYCVFITSKSVQFSYEVSIIQCKERKDLFATGWAGTGRAFRWGYIRREGHWQVEELHEESNQKGKDVLSRSRERSDRAQSSQSMAGNIEFFFFTCLRKMSEHKGDFIRKWVTQFSASQIKI